MFWAFRAASSSRAPDRCERGHAREDHEDRDDDEDFEEGEARASGGGEPAGGGTNDHLGTPERVALTLRKYKHMGG
jgi:hypothetical protein